MRASPAPSDAVEYAGDEGAAPRQPGTKHPGTMQLLEIIQDQEGGTGGTPLPLKSQGTAGGAGGASSSSARVRDWNAISFPRRMDPYSNGLERKRALGSVSPYAELPVDHFSFFVRSRAFNALKFCLQPSPTFHCYSVCVRNSKVLPRSHSIYFSTAS